MRQAAKKIFRSLLRGGKRKNLIADKRILPVSSKELLHAGIIDGTDMEINERDLVEWTDRYFPDAASIFGTSLHKKMLELFISFTLLKPESEDVFLDAAGGQFSYAGRLNCSRRILQDIRISEKIKSQGNQVEYLECSCASIPLEDQSVNKISCHHSIEHFRDDADIRFIVEVQRLLGPGGKCVIVPLFISDQHYLLTDTPGFAFWDEQGEKITDVTATLPGGTGSGNFSRIYSVNSFKERILDAIDRTNFHATLHFVKMGGNEIPDERHFFTSGQAKMNLGYRALLIERK